jgi:hypothetical protein
MGRGKAALTLSRERACYEILQEIQPASVRAVCYQLFNRKLIESMAKSQINTISAMLTRLREEGVVPWSWIVDGTRELQRSAQWGDIEEYARAVERSYRKDYWEDQPTFIEVWSEKSTVEGTLWPVIRTTGVGFRSLHGYNSATKVHEAASASAQDDRQWIVFYVGDWDPDGLYMDHEDLPRRLDEYGGDIDLRRLALAAGDLGTRVPDDASFPPEDKKDGSRYRWFKDRYTTRCWELDALNPNVLRARVEAAIREEIDEESWARMQLAEAAEKESLRQIMGQWRAQRGSQNGDGQ